MLSLDHLNDLYSELCNVKVLKCISSLSFTMCYILGQKTCLHLHGVFPYLYVPYDGYGQQPESYLSQMAFSIDRALNVALGNPSSTAQHVFKVSLVSGM